LDLFFPGEGPMEVKLVVTKGRQAGKEISVPGPKFLIGRGAECQLRPQSNLVSRKHCAILVEHDSVIIEDFGSTNHTFVNDEEVSTPMQIKTGDRIRVGMLELEVRLSVSVGGKKKPAVHSVQEAAARTVASAPAPAPQEDLDISGWLGDDVQPGPPPPHKESSTFDDTMAGKSLVDTTTIAVNVSNKEEEKEEKEEKEEDKKKESAPKGSSKFQRSVHPTSESSGEAAADMLRQFFHRKK
jgi:pSer/pThr/pTyr-binding forkhead associated (FHA) protein